MPAFTEDDYLDFCVTEALVVRAGQDRKKADKRRQAEEWKKQGVQNAAPDPPNPHSRF